MMRIRGGVDAGEQSTLRFSASDLVKFSQCEHLLWLEQAATLGIDGFVRPKRSEEAALMGEKGEEHEAAQVEILRQICAEQGEKLVEVPGKRLASETEREISTRDAMVRGAKFIVQAVLTNGDWSGEIDLLRRVDSVPSPDVGWAWSYEVVDMKLSRSAKPQHVLQLCLYSDLVESVQGVRPTRAYLLLGTGEEHVVDLATCRDWYQVQRELFESRVAQFSEAAASLEATASAAVPEDAGGDAPEPVPHCQICEWAPRCKDERERADHLSLVANITGSARRKLRDAGVHTVADLAALPVDAAVPRLSPSTFEKLHHQARLQVAGRSAGEHILELLPADPDKGLDALPAPDALDLFFDLEGDPYISGGGLGAAGGKGGLEYLWGMVGVDAGAPEFHIRWAHEPAAEKAAFEWFIDEVTRRRSHSDGAHVFHYANYEIAALKRMASRHATREYELDALLRANVFVDLYRVVTQAMRTSQPSYSIKYIEAFYRPVREGEVQTAGSSIVAYERWIETRDDKILKSIKDYNEDDCVSTLELRDWLLKLRDSRDAGDVAVLGGSGDGGVGGEGGEGGSAAVVDTDAEGGDDDDQYKGRDMSEFERARDLLVPPESDVDELAESRERQLLAGLLFWFWRESKTYWWARYEWLDMTPDELVEVDECVGGIYPEPVESWIVETRTHYRLVCEPQHSKLGAGDNPLATHDDDGFAEARGKPPGVQIESIDAQAGELVISRPSTRDDEPIPRVLIPGVPPPSPKQEGRLLELAAILARVHGEVGDAVDDDAFVADADHVTDDDASADVADDLPHFDVDEETPGARIALGVLRRTPPEIDGVETGAELMPRGVDVDIERFTELCANLRESCIPVQGPPGTGKTWSTAQVVVRLLERGLKVGISAFTHDAIKNLITAIEDVAVERGFNFSGIYKPSRTDKSWESGACITTESVYKKRRKAESNKADPMLFAGTAWYWSGPDVAADVLFVDEASQMALAHALAMCFAARRGVVFVGDPQQLPQVTKASHPEGGELSVLQHLIGDSPTVDPARGVLLPITRRMNPKICSFISEAIYEGELHPHESTGRHVLFVSDKVFTNPTAADRFTSETGLSGLRWNPVESSGCSTANLAEVAEVKHIWQKLVGGRWRDREGALREITPEDVLVVAPFNVQVSVLKSALPDGARVGTVDRFQGQQAPIVIYSMTSSTRDDAPRNLDFLLSRNRLNVAISRAQCLAVMIASPALLASRCNSIGDIELVNLLCGLSRRN